MRSNYSNFYCTAKARPRIRWDLSTASPSRVSRIFPSRRISCGLRGNIFIVFSPQPGGGNFGSLQDLITPVPTVSMILFPPSTCLFPTQSVYIVPFQEVNFCDLVK